MITGAHACWVSNATASKPGGSARKYGVSQSYYGPLYDNEQLGNM